MNFLKNIYNKISEFFLFIFNKLDNNKLAVSVIICMFFAIITNLAISFHTPWLDEAQAWLVAKNLNFFQIIDYMKYEGHMFLWFLILMPFAKLNMTYPYPMQMINLIFMCISVFLLCYKSKLNFLLKILIVFSYPICFLYSNFARCYALSIMLLFILTAFFKDKLKHPIIYAICIFLCANSSVMALIGAVAFGVLLFIDFIKENKDFYKSKDFYIICTIALITAIFLGLQLLGAGEQSEWLKNNTPLLFKAKHHLVLSFNNSLFLSGYKMKNVICGYLGALFAILCFYFGLKKSKLCTSLYLYFIISLTLIFAYVYAGAIYHHAFYFIYIIIAYWLYYEKINKPTLNIGIIFLILISFHLVLGNILAQCLFTMDKNSYADTLVQKVMQNKHIRDNNIIICDELATSTVPYFDNNNKTVYSCFDSKKATYFNRSLRQPIDLDSRYLTKEHLQMFENKPMYLIYTLNLTKQQYSKDYKREIVYCAPHSHDDGGYLCIDYLIPIWRNYEK